MNSSQQVAEVIESLLREKGLSVNKMLKDCGLAARLIGNMKAGSMPSADKLATIADYLVVSIDYLLGKSDSQNEPDYANSFNALPEADQKDLEKQIERFRSDLTTIPGLMFDGEPVTAEAMESIFEAMKIGMALTKEKNKKFTPKKYRNKNKTE